MPNVGSATACDAGAPTNVQHAAEAGSPGGLRFRNAKRGPLPDGPCKASRGRAAPLAQAEPALIVNCASPPTDMPSGQTPKAPLGAQASVTL